MKRLNNIPFRLRLTVFFILFTLLPIAITSITAGILGARESQTRQLETLNAIASLKQNQIENWMDEVQTELLNLMDRETENRRVQTLLRTEPQSEYFETIYGLLSKTFGDNVRFGELFQEISIINPLGEVLLSTTPEVEGQNFSQAEFFKQGLKGNYISSLQYDPKLRQPSIILARPIISGIEGEVGKLIGVVVAKPKTSRLTSLLLNRTGLGNTGETYLVGEDENQNVVLLTSPRSSEASIGASGLESIGIQRAIDYQATGATLYDNYLGKRVMGAYRWIDSLGIALLAEQELSEALAAQRRTTNTTIAITLLSLLFAILAAWLISGSFTRPILSLATSADKIAGGDFEVQIPPTGEDEIGKLANAFGRMTEQLRDMVAGLEQRVADRTKDLQIRSDQLEAAADISRTVSTVLEGDRLIAIVVELIRQRFELYYVGLFLIDERREWAILKAGTGQAGQAMLMRGHRLKIDEDSMIGWGIVNARARIAQRADLDPIRRSASELPDTRSEIAIPLRSRGEIIGAITIQSEIADAFDTDTLVIFQSMADQIGVAIDNARLFSEVQRSLETVQEAYGQLSRQAWLERLQARPIGFQRDKQGLHRIAGLTSTAATDSALATGERPQQTDAEVVIPITLRGETIGYVNAQKPDSAGTQEWHETEIEVLSKLIDQLSVSLESARLYEETQQKAEYERLVSQSTSRMRATLDIDTVLQTAAKEMLTILELEQVEVRMGLPVTDVLIRNGSSHTSEDHQE